MTLARTKRLLIALLAQVTLCLSLAPVMAAQQPPQKQASKGSESPAGGGLAIQAAREAANGRPEEVSESERSQEHRAGRVSTRRFARGIQRRVETRPTESPEERAVECAPPHADNVDVSVAVARASTPARGLDTTGRSTCPCHQVDFAFSTQSDASLTLLVSPNSLHQTLQLLARTQFLGNTLQPTGPPAN